MSYSLNTTVLNPTSKEKPKNAVILCHGYGGDGKDISLLAAYWRTYLKDTIFICPDAPEKCSVSPTGFQWFDLMDQTQDQILVKSLVAEIKLNKLVDEVKNNYNLQKPIIKNYIGAISAGIIDNKPLLDLDYIEDSKAQVDANFVICDSGKISEIQVTGEEFFFSDDQFNEIFKLAKKGIEEIIKAQKKVLS